MKSIIGVVRVPVIRLLCASSEWRKYYGYPEATRKDWAGITELRGSTPIGVLLDNKFARGSLHEEMAFGGKDLVVQSSHCIRIAQNLSFYKFMFDRAIEEARAYSKHGISHLILDFTADTDYYEINEPVVYWLARVFADEFKNACKNDFTVGIRMTNDIWATDIACRFGYDFVFCTESWHWGNMAEERNKSTDSTDKKKPAIYLDMYTYNVGDKFQGLADACLEGCVIHGEDEDMIDNFGKKRDELAKAGAPRIPIIGFYSEEIKRGELHSDMTQWGARDYIMLDMEVRKDGLRCNPLDDGRLQEICDRIAKFK